MWRWLVAKVNCWSPGRHPLCRIFLFSQALVQYHNRYSPQNKCVCVLNNIKMRSFQSVGYIVEGRFHSFVVLSSNRRTKQKNEVKYQHIEIVTLKTKGIVITLQISTLHFLSQTQIISFHLSEETFLFTLRLKNEPYVHYFYMILN